MFIAWTTTAQRIDADRLARGAVELHLAACAQVDGPINSYYHSEGRLEQAEEFRVWFKYLPDSDSPLKIWVHQHHPYSTPQWIVVAAENVGEKYLSWAKANSTPPPFHSQKSP